MEDFDTILILAAKFYFPVDDDTKFIGLGESPCGRYEFPNGKSGGFVMQEYMYFFDRRSVFCMGYDDVINVVAYTAAERILP